MFGTAVQLFAGLKISAFANESLEEIVAHAKAMEYDFPVFQDVDNPLADLLGAKQRPTFSSLTATVAFCITAISKMHSIRSARKIQLCVGIEATLEDRPVTRRETRARGCAVRHARGRLN
jgi:hypothetical protein